jgi:hypothetical protein
MGGMAFLLIYSSFLFKLIKDAANSILICEYGQAAAPYDIMRLHCGVRTMLSPAQVIKTCRCWSVMISKTLGRSVGLDIFLAKVQCIFGAIPLFDRHMIPLEVRLARNQSSHTPARKYLIYSSSMVNKSK